MRTIENFISARIGQILALLWLKKMRMIENFISVRIGEILALVWLKNEDD